VSLPGKRRGVEPNVAIASALVGLLVAAFPRTSHAEPAATSGNPAEPAPTATAPETPTPPRPSVDAMQQRIETLEARVEALQDRQAELESQQARDQAEPSPPPSPASPSEPEAEEPPPPVVSGDPTATADNRPPNYADGFHFGSYGRVLAGGDHRGRPGRSADIVAYGSRIDEGTYAELELRREDYWEETGAFTRIVSTVAFAHPIFHYDAQFDATLAIRNLYIEESGLGLKKLRVWAGSRMYRGDDIYLLNFWPLDNLNTIGGGVGYTFLDNLDVRLHAGINQPTHGQAGGFFYQTAKRPAPLGQLGERTVAITDRQKVISSLGVSNIFWVGKNGAGVKPKIYGEVHYTGQAQEEVADRQFDDLPQDAGFVAGAQLGAFTGKRSTHLNLVFRYAGGLAAYGEFNAPWQVAPDGTSKGAREILTALSGNYEVGPFGILAGAYWRTFRNASPDLDYWDISEGIVAVRPTVWFGKNGGGGVSVEGSYQAQQRGVLLTSNTGTSRPQFGQMGRVGVIPFISPGGRGNYQRPHLQLFYVLSVRDDGARRLYPRDDVFSLRGIDHFFGLGAEWWFGSTSYFRD
jgi:maltoporin